MCVCEWVVKVAFLPRVSDLAQCCSNYTWEGHTRAVMYLDIG